MDVTKHFGLPIFTAWPSLVAECSAQRLRSVLLHSETRTGSKPLLRAQVPQRTGSSWGGLTAVTHHRPNPAFKTIFWLQEVDLGYVSLMFEELGVPIAQGRAEGGTCKDSSHSLPVLETPMCMAVEMQGAVGPAMLQACAPFGSASFSQGSTWKTVQKWERSLLITEKHFCFLLNLLSLSWHLQSSCCQLPAAWCGMTCWVLLQGHLLKRGDAAVTCLVLPCTTQAGECTFTFPGPRLDWDVGASKHCWMFHTDFEFSIWSQCSVRLSQQQGWDQRLH